MQKTILYLHFLIFLPVTINAQEAYPISPQAKISLITCAPGSALFEAFGHSAIRVYDIETGIDIAYNYGVFDFDQPNFYLNFAKGYLLYQLGTSSFSNFLYRYTYFNRSVDEQVLNLTYSQKMRIYQYLHWNSLPENKAYYYDYFFDNCATRPRDVLKQILGDQLQLDYSFADTLHYSIRDLTDRYLLKSQEHAWGDLGIDLCLGAGIDRLARPSEYVYQPEFLQLAFKNAKIVGKDGQIGPLVASTNNLFQAKKEQHSEVKSITPTLIFWSLFVLVSLVTAIEINRRQYYMLFFDLALFKILGLLGLVLLSIWIFTNHTAAAKNWNILWCWPTHLFITGMWYIKSLRSFIQFHLIFTVSVNLIIIIFWYWIPQDMHEAFIPIILMIIIRSLVMLLFGLKENQVIRLKQNIIQVG